MARILIIEDNAANLNLMSYLLMACGHTVEGARDGMSGLNAVRWSDPRFDLVLCDIQLPRMSGYQVAQALRADPAQRDLPLVAVSALAMRGDRERGLAAGFNGYIEKPIQPESFGDLVQSFLPEAARKGPGQPVAHTAAAEPPAPARPAGRQHTVLAVDDVAANRGLIEVILQSAGYRVLAARSMQQALELMRRENVDLVISDVYMGGGDGFAFRRAAAQDPALAHLPFIFVSSSAITEQDRLAARELGCQLLERPLEPHSLINVVQALLRSAKPDA